MKPKTLDRLITIAFLFGFILTPVSITLNLCGNVLFDNAQYVSFVKWNDFAIDAGLFTLSAFYICSKLFGNPSSDTSQDDISESDIGMN